ncbi:hypothetical protein F511_31149 [Dorcoceras hygrometricum]|uniref:PDZ domain-containing protein n=1 Tax=Dorcoceras hygrometricum TaxID=472368 RepID=A0A2Z7BZT7_9LAMI|nr:hypothetical protein F511_31149 [Dorcoceras hygrometricum]
MASTSSSYSACLSLPAAISQPTKQYCPSLIKLRSIINIHPFSTTFCNAPKPSSNFVVRASKAKVPEQYEEYEVELIQPYGLKFVKGRDGGTYIDAIAAGGSADKSGMFSVGDKVIATSAVFGDEIWPAAEYGRTMYTIRQRIGNLDNTGELTEKEIIRNERNAGFISNKVREIQLQNYIRKKEKKEQREKDLREGLQLYKNGKYNEALEKFESVLGSKPEPQESAVASYNVACCYSNLNQVKAALSALDDALKVGFEDFKRIRTDPDLANVRETEEFETLLKKYDESFINESAIQAIKSLFGFNKK